MSSSGHIVGKGLHMLFMSMHVQLEPFTPVMWLWKGLHMLSMENPINFPQVGHLGLRFQNEAMYINGPLQTLFMSRHFQLKSFTPEIWLWKGLHMLSMGNRRSAILDQSFKIRLCTSMDHYKHCSWDGMSSWSHPLLRSGCGKVSIC